MRVPLLQQALLLGACLFTGCSTPQTAPGGATVVEEPRASANPPSVMTTQKSIPAASSSFPSAHKMPAALPVSTAPAGSARSGSGAHTPSNISDQTVDTSKNETEANFDNLELVDTSLKGRLSILRVGSDPTDNNLLSVFVGLKNRTSHPLPLEIQTIYKDKLGNPMNQGSWVPLTLKPHEQTEYRSTSISTDASDFLVRIRTAATTGAN